MNRYLFVFGFETPLQAQNNALRGWDDEDSECLVIIAPSEKAASDWGKQVGERFIAELFKDSSASWRAGEFAQWIEEDRGKIDDAIRAGAPVVHCGQFPDFGPWLERRSC